MMDKRYSVLMSVYKKERPEYLHAALKSMTGQSWRPSEIVLVCDGPLTTELEAVLKDAEFHSLLKTVRLEKNAGLGAALAKGLPECSCEWVARMDSDDIAASNRCEKQLRYSGDISGNGCPERHHSRISGRGSDRARGEAKALSPGNVCPGLRQRLHPI
ncbi:MAG: glycosyltransferase [Clostridium sp.]